MVTPMQLALRRNFIALIFLILNTTLYNLEKPSSSPLMSLAFPGQDPSRPPLIFVNNERPYCHNIALKDNGITIKSGKFFCLAQVAVVPKPPPDKPQDPIILIKYDVNGFNERGLELLTKRIELVPEQNRYWHYLVFQAKQRKGTFEINLVPCISSLEQKQIKVTVT